MLAEGSGLTVFQIIKIHNMLLFTVSRNWRCWGEVKCFREVCKPSFVFAGPAWQLAGGNWFTTLPARAREASKSQGSHRGAPPAALWPLLRGSLRLGLKTALVMMSF